MKKIFITITCLFAALVIGTHAQAQKVLLDEDFNTNKNGWLTYTGKPGFLIYNGKLIFAVDDSLTYNINMPVTVEDGVNFSVTATSTHTDGTNEYGYGIFFGASDLSNYYTFCITSGGYYRLAKSATSGYSEMIKWTLSPAIKTGNYVDNILQLSRQGFNWVLAVNGQTLATVPATAFFGNKIGFTQSVRQRVEYDNVRVVLN